jgi:hypothetical protein
LSRRSFADSEVHEISTAQFIKGIGVLQGSLAAEFWEWLDATTTDSQ